MTKFVTIIGNGKSRLGFDITPMKKFSTVIGCNAQFRDYNFDYFVCADKHMCQEAVNTVGKNTNIYTRDRWHKEFAMWPNVKKLPELPYSGDKRPDEPFTRLLLQGACGLGASLRIGSNRCSSSATSLCLKMMWSQNLVAKQAPQHLV